MPISGSAIFYAQVDSENRSQRRAKLTKRVRLGDTEFRAKRLSKADRRRLAAKQKELLTERAEKFLGPSATIESDGVHNPLNQLKQIPKVELTQSQLAEASQENEHFNQWANSQITACPMIVYLPTGKQQEFLKLNSFIQVFSGGNWAGKTTTVVTKIAQIIWDFNNPWTRLPHLSDFPKGTRGRFVSTHTAIDTDLVPNIKFWFPDGYYSSKKGGRQYESHFTCYSKSTKKQQFKVCEFDIMTYDQKPDEFESVKLDWCVFDEPPPEGILNATIARMKEHGIILIGMTPLTGAGHIFDKLERDLNTEMGHVIAKTGRRLFDIVTADVESACITHGIRGYMTHEAIMQKIALYDPEEREARIEGKPMHLSGLIYKEWARSLHVIEPFDIPSSWTRYQIVDPHDRRPYACIWVAVSPDEKLYIYAEYPTSMYHEIKSSSLTPEDYAKVFQEIENSTGGPANFRIMDARFGPKQSSQTASSIMEQFDDLGLYYDPSYTDGGASIQNGHQRVKEYLKPGSDKTPSLKVFSHCTNVIYQLEHYCWDDYKPGVASVRGQKERPKEAFKDFPDCIRYFIMDDPMFIKGEETEPSLPHWAHDAQALVGVPG